MTGAAAAVPTHTPLSFRQRAGFAIALACSAASFLTIGWRVLAPENPYGALTLLGDRMGALSIVVVVVLAALVASLTTMLAGRRLVDVGAFAACIGIGLLSLRGGTAGIVLIEAAEARARGASVNVAVQFATEALIWFAVVVVALVVCAATHRRMLAFWADRTREDGASGGVAARASDADEASAPLLCSMWDVPRPARSGAPIAELRTAPGAGLMHVLVAASVGLLGVHLFSTGLSNRAITHGQACFVALAAAFLATWVAGRIVPVQSALWSIVAVPIFAIGGYLWASTGGLTLTTLPDLPASPFLRILPGQLIAVGVASAIGTTWWMRGGDGPDELIVNAAGELVTAGATS